MPNSHPITLCHLTSHAHQNLSLLLMIAIPPPAANILAGQPGQVMGMLAGGGYGSGGGGVDSVNRRRTVSQGTLMHARSMPLGSRYGRSSASGMGGEGEDGAGGAAAGSRASPGLKMRRVPSYRRIASSERLAAVAASFGAAATAPATGPAVAAAVGLAEGPTGGVDVPAAAATAAPETAAAAATATATSAAAEPPSPAPSLSSINGSSSASGRKARGRQLDVRRLISKVGSAGSSSAGGAGAGSSSAGVVGGLRGRLASLAASTGRLRRAAADYVHDNIPALPAIIDTVGTSL